MALQSDDTVCFCFHVSLRKVENFCRIEKPAVPSLISQCLSAGTGCGWCVPMLQRIHRQICGDNQPWWRGLEACEKSSPSPRFADPGQVDAQAYSAGRADYLSATGRKPPIAKEPHV